jgi:hypothetical protein
MQRQQGLHIKNLVIITIASVLAKSEVIHLKELSPFQIIKNPDLNCSIKNLHPRTEHSKILPNPFKTSFQFKKIINC